MLLVFVLWETVMQQHKQIVKWNLFSWHYDRRHRGKELLPNTCSTCWENMLGNSEWRPVIALYSISRKLELTAAV